jgi:hypothetical protein
VRRPPGFTSGDPLVCGSFASAWMHSRSSSSSDSSQLQDYVAPTAFPVHTCKASPTLSSVASGLVEQGAVGKQRVRRYALRGTTAISDTASLTGGNDPTGTITFRLYGPDDADCLSAPVFSSSATVIGSGYYQSGSHVPTAIGTYRWRVNYSGDQNNRAAGPTGCGDTSETVTVVKASPGLSSTASGVSQRHAKAAGRGRRPEARRTRTPPNPAEQGRKTVRPWSRRSLSLKNQAGYAGRPCSRSRATSSNRSGLLSVVRSLPRWQASRRGREFSCGLLA